MYCNLTLGEARTPCRRLGLSHGHVNSRRGLFCGSIECNPYRDFVWLWRWIKDLSSFSFVATFTWFQGLIQWLEGGRACVSLSLHSWRTKACSFCFNICIYIKRKRQPGGGIFWFFWKQSDPASNKFFIGQKKNKPLSSKRSLVSFFLFLYKSFTAGWECMVPDLPTYLHRCLVASPVPLILLAICWISRG